MEKVVANIASILILFFFCFFVSTLYHIKAKIAQPKPNESVHYRLAEARRCVTGDILAIVSESRTKHGISNSNRVSFIV